MITSNIDTRCLEQVLNRLKAEFGTFYGVSLELKIHRAHIYNFMSGNRRPSRSLIKSLQDNGYIPKPPKRIRSQITWESDEQKEYFQKFVFERGFETVSDYCRYMANQRIEWKHIYIGWDAIWKDE